MKTSILRTLEVSIISLQYEVVQNVMIRYVWCMMIRYVWCMMIWYDMIWYVLWYGMLYYAMLWYVMINYDMLCYVMIHYDMSWWNIFKRKYHFQVFKVSMKNMLLYYLITLCMSLINESDNHINVSYHSLAWVISFGTVHNYDDMF